MYDELLQELKDLRRRVLQLERLEVPSATPYAHPNHTGDVTSVGDGATTIANDAVTNAKLANMAQDTLKGRTSGAGTGDPVDLTATQARTILNVASGADVTGTAITALATKTPPVDADAIVITDSAASDAPKRTLWSNIKATLKTYFDTLYVALTGNQTIAGIKTFSDTAHFDGILRLSANSATQDYNFSSDAADALTLQAQGAGKAFDLRMFTEDADGTDNIILTLWGVGKTGATANRERLIFGYLAASLAFEFQSEANGTGTLRPIIIYTEGNSNQLYIGTDGLVGVGIVGLAKLHVLQATLGNAVHRLQSTATNDDPVEVVYQNRVTTTDNTSTLLHSFTVAASTTVVIEATVLARRTGGVAGTAEDGAGYQMTGTYKNVAGVATAIGFTMLITQESQVGFTAALAPTTTNTQVELRVVGVVNNNLTWHMTARFYSVGS